VEINIKPDLKEIVCAVLYWASDSDENTKVILCEHGYETTVHNYFFVVQSRREGEEGDAGLFGFKNS
jgi:hypothetical protein